jgi:cytochrome c556
MKFTTKIIALSLVMAGGIALAEGATDPDVKARQALMDANGGAMKTLGGMAEGKVAFDAAAAEAAKAILVAGAADVPAKWANNASDPASHSKPDIWTSMDDFKAKAGDFGKASAALDTTSVDGIKAGLGAIGGTCKACHTAYKAS